MRLQKQALKKYLSHLKILQLKHKYIAWEVTDIKALFMIKIISGLLFDSGYNSGGYYYFILRRFDGSRSTILCHRKHKKHRIIPKF